MGEMLELCTQIRPDAQLSGTVKLTELPGAACHLGAEEAGQHERARGVEATYPVGWLGIAVPTLRSVKI